MPGYSVTCEHLDVNAATWISLGSAVVAALAFVAAGFQAKHARRQAEAATEQTKLQRDIYMDSLAPSVWVDIRSEGPGSVIVVLVVGNSGRTVARNVRVTFEPPLRMGETLLESSTAQERLRQGVASLPPDRTMVWRLGSAFELFAEDASPIDHRVKISAEGPNRKVVTDDYVIRPFDLVGTKLGREEGTLADVANAIDNLAQRIRRPSSGFTSRFRSAAARSAEGTEPDTAATSDGDS